MHLRESPEKVRFRFCRRVLIAVVLASQTAVAVSSDASDSSVGYFGERCVTFVWPFK